MKQFQLSPKPEAGAPATGPVMPRQKRAQRTRTALLAAVEALVASEGADAKTTTRMAEITGVSVGTIYRYFSDREQLLLAAYDGTVARIVETCGEALADLDAGMPMAKAARKLLGLYLDTAETIPAHSGLLAAMRALRPIEADQGGGNEASIIGDIVAPFLEKFSGGPGSRSFPPALPQRADGNAGRSLSGDAEYFGPDKAARGDRGAYAAGAGAHFRLKAAKIMPAKFQS